MKFLTPVLLAASILATTASVIPSLQAAAVPNTGIEQFPAETPTTFPIYPIVPIEQFPEQKESMSLIDANSTNIAPPRTIHITPGGNPRPWRDSSGKFAGDNPFGSAPRRLY